MVIQKSGFTRGKGIKCNTKKKWKIKQNEKRKERNEEVFDGRTPGRCRITETLHFRAIILVTSPVEIAL